MIGFENWAGWLAVIMMLGFPIGIGVAIYGQRHGDGATVGIVIAVVSWVSCLLALGIKNKLKKKSWVMIEAKCIDREVLRCHSKNQGTTWAARILCEMNYRGEALQCTPVVHWRTFVSEPDANAFLGSRIDGNGCCTLKVNPKNPLEANLVARQIV